MVILPVINVPSPAAEPAFAVSAQVTHVTRTSTFAGRRGKLVRETWTVDVNGKLVTVYVSPYHTNVAGTPSFIHVGQTIEIPLSPEAIATTVRISQVGVR